jgi:hypothetical protein
MIRRLRILCFLVALWPGLAAAQSRELIEADKQVKAPYAQGRYAEAEPFAVEALRLGEKEFGPTHLTTIQASEKCDLAAEHITVRALVNREFNL